MCGIVLFSFFLFSSLVRNYNIKRPGFYMLQVTKVFSNFPQLKQLSKIKKACEIFMNCNLPEFEIPDSYTKTCRFFSFLLTMFSRSVVPEV